MNAIATGQPDATDNASATPAVPAREPVVLVVDDDPRVRQFLVCALVGAGCQVLEAEHGRTALALLARQPVDLLLTDLVMPEAEGIELIIEVRKTRPRLPIIAISGEGADGPGQFLTTARLVGAHRTLAKPFGPDELTAAVHGLLASRPPA